ncbi:MAG TPA: mechanosensitive ion channel family protein, partial [Streptomyces sp.]
EPWNELLWSSIDVVGLDSVLLDSMVIHLTARTMPGKRLAVERELRWRIKRAFDAASIQLVGGTAAPADEPPTDPSDTIAAPSAFSNSESPQVAATTPITSAVRQTPK